MNMISIDLPIFLKMGTVHCYLLQDQSGFMLVDCGGANGREALVAALGEAGCRPGDLKLVVLTHGDFDHIGNAAYLRAKYGAQIAMHAGALGMARDGDMFYNRTPPNPLVRSLISAFFRLGKSDHFTPDLLLEDGQGLSTYGFGATVNALPGHSGGSIGILTDQGDFFSGDLLVNHQQPVLNDIMDDLETGNASVARLKRLPIRKIYPGHGEPFTLDEITSGL
jgi:hydroxyacylglutathione hydrolase